MELIGEAGRRVMTWNEWGIPFRIEDGMFSFTWNSVKYEASVFNVFAADVVLDNPKGFADFLGKDGRTFRVESEDNSGFSTRATFRGGMLVPDARFSNDHFRSIIKQVKDQWRGRHADG